MTTEELIEQLDVEDGVSDDINAGLRTGADGEKYVVIYTPDDVEMLAVPTNATNWLDIHYDWYTSSDDIAAPVREVISSLISQYLNTPVSKRSPKKKYCLLWQEDTYGGSWALGYDKTFRSWEINNEKWLNNHHYQTRFTDDDLEEIADGDQEMLARLNALKKKVRKDAC